MNSKRYAPGVALGPRHQGAFAGERRCDCGQACKSCKPARFFVNSLGPFGALSGWLDHVPRLFSLLVLDKASKAPGVGTWRSLVAHLLGVQGVASSNLAVPILSPFAVGTIRLLRRGMLCYGCRVVVRGGCGAERYAV